MTREHARQEREVFNAFCDGAEIEERHIETGITARWNEEPSPVFSEYYEHRIKPKPVDVEELKHLVEKWRHPFFSSPTPTLRGFLFKECSEALERVLNGGKA